MSDEFQQFERKAVLAEMRPYRTGEDLTGVSVSDTDRTNGSPKEGDMIARDPKDRDSRWLVSAEYFAQNFNPQPVGNLGMVEAPAQQATEEETAYKRTGTNTRESLLRGPRGSEF